MSDMAGRRASWASRFVFANPKPNTLLRGANDVLVLLLGMARANS